MTKTALVALNKRRLPSYDEPDFDEITVIQPLVGGDANLEEILEYNLPILPEATFLWLVDEGDDRALDTVQAIIGRNPDAHIEILTCPPAPKDISAKSFKLGFATRGRPGTFLFYDDDVRITREAAIAMVGALEDVQVSTPIPCYVPGENLASRFFAQGQNNGNILSLLSGAAFTDTRAICGMGFAMKSETIENFGGFAAFEAELTDDTALAKHVLSTGGSIRQLAEPIFVETELANFNDYFTFLHRWTRFALVFVQARPPAIQVLNLIFMAVPSICLSVVAAGAAGSLFTDPKTRKERLKIVAMLLGFRAANLTMLQQWIIGAVQYRPVLSILSELVQPVHYVHALIQPRISWRGTHYDLAVDGTFTKIQ